jgi:two-component system, LuxR family, sensor kinase FixL
MCKGPRYDSTRRVHRPPASAGPPNRNNHGRPDLEPVIIPIVWSLSAGVCFALATVYLMAWFNEVGERETLAFFVFGSSLGLLTLVEMFLMLARTPEAAAWVIRWAHVPITALVISMVAFLHLYFGSRRLWLGYAAIALRLAGTVANFASDLNLNYLTITHLHTISIFGERASVPIGEPNPWMLLGRLSSLALLLFAIDATLAGWRRGGSIDRRRAVLIGGTLIAWIVVAAGQAMLVTSGIVRFAFLFGLPSIVVMLAIAFELGADTVRTLHMSARLKQSEAELRRNAEQLGRERSFLRQMIDTIPGLIFAKDREGRYTLANKTLAALYGVKVEQMTGRTDAELNPHEAEARRFRAVDLAVMDTRSERLIAEEPLTAVDGTPRWFMTHKVPILGADGSCDQMLGSSIDITARKQAEIEVEQQRNELAHLSRVSMLSELSGSLTHELNQPLTAILSNAQAALRFLDVGQPDLDEVRDILRDIVADDRRAGEVIGSLRVLLRRGEPRRDTFDLNELVHDVLRLLRGDLLNAGVALTVDCAAGLPSLHADRVQLQQVLLNLVINACEAMVDVAAPDRHLAVFTLMGDDQSLKVLVTDQGLGIPSTDLERVFEPFLTTKPEGLGLGLSICRRIVTAHGGVLRASNNPAGGTTFSLTLRPGNPAANIAVAESP